MYPTRPHKGRTISGPSRAVVHLTMGLKELAAILALRDIQSGPVIDEPDQGLLCVVARHRNARRPAVLVEARFSNDTVDLVAVAQRLAQRLEDDGAYTLLETNISMRRVVVVRGHFEFNDLLLWRSRRHRRPTFWIGRWARSCSACSPSQKSWAPGSDSHPRRWPLSSGHCGAAVPRGGRPPEMNYRLFGVWESVIS